VNDQTTIHTLYNKLLGLYPRKFKERLGESMQQTFRDLCSERRSSKSALFGFVLWTFIETANGIIQEDILALKEIDLMKSFLTNLKSPALISLFLVIPFMIMEVVSTRNLTAIFNAPLFGILWLLPMIFIIILMPFVRNMRAGNNIAAKPITFVLSIIFLVLIALAWGGIVADQMPCFLGVPNCD
jgi:hypothetical protein